MIEKLRMFDGAVNEALEGVVNARESNGNSLGSAIASCLVIHFYRDKQRLPVSNNTNWNRHSLWQRFYLPFKRLYRVDPDY